MISRRIGRLAAVALAIMLAGAPVSTAAEEGAVGATVRISPLSVALDVSASSVPVGKTFRARGTVSNGGTSAVRDVVVELRLDPDGLAVRQGRGREIGLIKAGRSASVSWTVCAGTPGAYVLLVQATADGATVESAAQIVSVTDGGQRSC